jgi:hypothetical protein
MCGCDRDLKNTLLSCTSPGCDVGVLYPVKSNRWSLLEQTFVPKEHFL